MRSTGSRILALRRLIILWWRWVRERAGRRVHARFRGETMNGMLREALFLLASTLLLANRAAAQTSYDLRSPNNRIEVRIRTANGIRYDVLLGGRAILQDCTLSLDVDH